MKINENPINKFDKKLLLEAKSEIQEAIAIFNIFQDFGAASTMNSTFASDGNLWNVIQDGNSTGGAFWSAFYWLSTFWFSKMQRYMGRYLYISNAYAATAVNNLAILSLGSGFEYTTDNKSKKKKLDKWLEENKWHERSKEAFKRFLIDGEVFFRMYGDQVRFVDPDLIFTSNFRNERGDQYSGIILDPRDNETVTDYEVHNSTAYDAGESEEVPASEMQHRANNHWGQRRGFSWLLPVAQDLFLADELTSSLMQSAKLRAKIGVIREHNSPQSNVGNFLSDIQDQPQNQYWKQFTGQNGGPVIPPVDNIENYPAGSIIDTSLNTKWVTLETVQADGFVAMLDATLRKISSHFHLPMAIFAQDKSERGAYAAELVSNSYLVRSIEAMQDVWKAYDKQLLSMAGFETDDITINTPEVSVVDKKAAIEEAAFLLNMGLISKKSLAKNYNIDYEKEKELIKQEKAEEGLDNDDVNARNNQSGRDNAGRSETVGAASGQDLRNDEQERT